MIKIVHVADVHFENSDYGQMPQFKSRLEENRYETFEKAVSVAIKRQVDLFVIAGDLFDGGKLTLKSVMRLNEQLRYLIDSGVRPVIAMGNHDPMDFYDQWDIQLPDECIVFGPEPEKIQLVSRDGEKYTLNGCSHESVGVIDNRGARYPMATAKMVNIGILHGTVSQWADSEEPYMPCSVSELAEKGYHLWCLGHIHKRKEIREVNGFYPGSLVGNKQGEDGPKGAYYYELIKGHLSYEFLPLSEVLFESLDIVMDSDEDRHSVDELLSHINKKIDLIRKKAEIDTGIANLKLVLSIDISGRSNLFYRLNDSSAIKYIEEHLESRACLEKIFLEVGGLLPDVDMSLVAQSGSFPGYCMELLKNPDFTMKVLGQIESQALAASGFFKSQNDEVAYRERLIENIERDVLKYLLREEAKA